MRQRFCRVCGGWHEIDAWPHNCLPERVLTRSALPAPSIQSDAMDGFQSMANGAIYDSKSRYRQSLKRHGMIEVGTDIRAAMTHNTKVDKVSKDDVGRALQKVKQGYKPKIHADPVSRVNDVTL